MNNKRTIVLMGNGKSIADLDLSTLNSVDTIGINGAFMMYQERNWFPTYYAMLRRMPAFWGEQGGVFDVFMGTSAHRFKQIFMVRGDYPEYSGLTNIQEINYIPPRMDTPDISTWSDSEEFDFQWAMRVLEREVGQEEANRLLSVYDGTVNERYNWRGIYKTIRGTGVALNDGDYIVAPRWQPTLDPPESFDRFTYSAGSAGYVAAHICRLMGYQRILLVGFDCRYKVDKRGIVNVQETFGINNVFAGKPYDVAADYACPKCRNSKYLFEVQLASWRRMKAMVSEHKLDLEIVNCTPKSKLVEFPSSTLEKELNR